MKINLKDRKQIEELIAEAERKSNSELVPMIVNRSDLYPAAQFRAAIIVSFIFSLLLYYSPLSIINPIYFLWIQIPGLLIGYMLGNIPAITRLLISKQEIEYEVTQRAIEAFFNHNLHLTNNHNGVLILISLMERKIKIITDKGIKDKIDQKIWDEIIYDFTQEAKNGEFVLALKKTIHAAGNVLETYFPKENANSKNEIKNNLIVE